VLGSALGLVVASVGWRRLGSGGNHLAAVRGVRGKHTAVDDGMAPWKWHERRETGDERERRKVDGGGSVGPRTAPAAATFTLPVIAFAAIEIPNVGAASAVACCEREHQAAQSPQPIVGQ